MYETEIHRVFTEQLHPVIEADSHFVIACEDMSDFDEGIVDELILTTNSEDVTCKLCLSVMN